MPPERTPGCCQPEEGEYNDTINIVLIAGFPNNVETVNVSDCNSLLSYKSSTTTIQYINTYTQSANKRNII